MKFKISIVTLLALTLLELMAQSCANNNTASNSAISVGINGDGSGCTVISYLDGGSPASMTTNGTFTNYSGVTNGSHSVSVYCPSISQGVVCTFTVSNNTHIMGIYNPCGGGGFTYSCN